MTHSDLTSSFYAVRTCRDDEATNMVFCDAVQTGLHGSFGRRGFRGSRRVGAGGRGGGRRRRGLQAGRVHVRHGHVTVRHGPARQGRRAPDQGQLPVVLKDYDIS